MANKDRQICRELYHMQEHADSAIGALSRNDKTEAITHIDMLRGMIRGSIEREESATRIDD